MARWLRIFALQSLGLESVFQQPHNKSEILRDAYNPTTGGGRDRKSTRVCRFPVQSNKCELLI